MLVYYHQPLFTILGPPSIKYSSVLDTSADWCSHWYFSMIAFSWPWTGRRHYRIDEAAREMVKLKKATSTKQRFNRDEWYIFICSIFGIICSPRKLRETQKMHKEPRLPLKNMANLITIHSYCDHYPSTCPFQFSIIQNFLGTSTKLRFLARIPMLQTQARWLLNGRCLGLDYNNFVYKIRFKIYIYMGII